MTTNFVDGRLTLSYALLKMNARTDQNETDERLVQIVIPNVPDVLKAAIKKVAKGNQRSMASEIRVALEKHFGVKPSASTKAA